MRKLGMVLGAALLASASGAARPAHGAPGREAEIVMELHHDHQNQIAMGKLAERRGATRAVRELGAHLVRDHAAADRRLVSYALTIGVDEQRLDQPYDAANHGALKRPELASVSGAIFDRELASAVVAEHQAAIDRASAAQMMTGDQALKTLIGQALPTLRADLAEAQALAPSPAR